MAWCWLGSTEGVCCICHLPFRGWEGDDTLTTLNFPIPPYKLQEWYWNPLRCMLYRPLYGNKWMNSSTNPAVHCARQLSPLPFPYPPWRSKRNIRHIFFLKKYQWKASLTIYRNHHIVVILHNCAPPRTFRILRPRLSVYTSRVGIGCRWRRQPASKRRGEELPWLGNSEPCSKRPI